LILFVEFGHSFFFDLQRGEEKCYSEDVLSNFLITGDYYVVEPKHNMVLQLKVIEPEGSIIYEKVDDKGTFKFTTHSEGEFKFCFVDDFRPGLPSSPQPPRRVSIKLTIQSSQAVDNAQAATKEHVEPLQIDLMDVEEEVNALKNEFLYMKRREEAMRDTNESTNSRSAWMSLLCIAIMLSTSFWQIFYLKRYFRIKKLI